MDNQDYLDKIAVNPQQTTTNQLLSPKMIKIIIGGVIALIFILALAVMVNHFNSQNKNVFERYHLRLQNLSAQTGPIATYTKDLKSSDLRALANTLRSSLSVAANNYSPLLSNVKIDPANISADATEAETFNLTEYTSKLKSAKQGGLLDRSFAVTTSLQISQILSQEAEIRTKTKDTAILNVVDTSTENLKILYQNFTDFANSN